MRVMLTGATGFTGSHTARALLARGHRVRALVRDVRKLEKIFGADSPLCAEALEGDVTNERDVKRALDGCDAVAHTAALVDLRRSMAARVMETNTRGVELVIGGAVDRGLSSILYVSSLAVFFDPRRPRSDPLNPEEALAPASNGYGRSKIEAERFVRRLQDRGAPIRVSYPVGIFGPDDPGLSEGNGSILAWLGTLPVHTSSGLQIVDVRDLAQMHRVLLERPGGACRYVAAGELIAWSDMGPLLASLTGVPVRPLRIPGPLLRSIGRAGDLIKRFYDFDFPATYEAMCFASRWPGTDASKTVQDLGIHFRPKEETMRDTLAWLNRAGYLKDAVAGRLAQAERRAHAGG